MHTWNDVIRCAPTYIHTYIHKSGFHTHCNKYARVEHNKYACIVNMHVEYMYKIIFMCNICIYIYCM